jgi:cell division septal protein FtsQ
MGWWRRDALAKKKQATRKPVDKTKQAEKRARRDERKAADAQAKQAADRRRRVRTGFSVLAAVVVVGAIGFFIVDKATPDELAGVSNQAYDGRDHVESGQTVAYATATPTSGTHAASSPRCGIYSQQMPAEFAVHSLEHGAVVIWYQPSLASEEISGLETVVNRFDDRVILSPNAELTQPVVATAWNRLKAYDGADAELEQFIETYRNRGPESFRCAY